MTLSDGTYQIFSRQSTGSGKQLRVARYYTELILVNDSSNQTVDVKKISGDKYSIRYSGFDNYFGPTDDIKADNTLNSRPGQYEWSINSAGGDEYKVHVPEQDLYWQLPEGAGNESRISLVKSQGKQGELWTFVRK
ncbi:hypothetical protein FRC08_011970 [Ceratobasidium sp. 394]|nr:hypothetical protein FRC08_011970 [Ceratobasidium sp. 394]KAG9076400.1 hypothetical protein FS749_011822 [Ceratobasidium sp. UAMH 11750]